MLRFVVFVLCSPSFSVLLSSNDKVKDEKIILSNLHSPSPALSSFFVTYSFILKMKLSKRQRLLLLLDPKKVTNSPSNAATKKVKKNRKKRINEMDAHFFLCNFRRWLRLLAKGKIHFLSCV